MIGTKYANFGIVLLENETGAIISAIEAQHLGNPVSICLEVLKRWLQGQGRHPVTWGVLVEVLRSIKLNVLAEDIEYSLRTAQQVSGYY